MSDPTTQPEKITGDDDILTEDDLGEDTSESHDGGQTTVEI